jgi:succinyl-CoA synthetase beta subunit
MMDQQVIIACAKGGTSIEDLAEKYPDQIIKVIVFLLMYVKVLCFFMDRCRLLGSS